MKHFVTTLTSTILSDDYYVLFDLEVDLPQIT